MCEAIVKDNHNKTRHKKRPQRLMISFKAARKGFPRLIFELKAMSPLTKI